MRAKNESVYIDVGCTPIPYLSSFYVLCTMSTDAAAAAAAHAAVCYHGFSKVGLPEAANNHYVFGSLCKAK